MMSSETLHRRVGTRGCNTLEMTKKQETLQLDRFEPSAARRRMRLSDWKFNKLQKVIRLGPVSLQQSILLG